MGSTLWLRSDPSASQVPTDFWMSLDHTGQPPSENGRIQNDASCASICLFHPQTPHTLFTINFKTTT